MNSDALNSYRILTIAEAGTYELTARESGGEKSLGLLAGARPFSIFVRSILLSGDVYIYAVLGKVRLRGGSLARLIDS